MSELIKILQAKFERLESVELRNFPAVASVLKLLLGREARRRFPRQEIISFLGKKGIAILNTPPKKVGRPAEIRAMVRPKKAQVLSGEELQAARQQLIELHTRFGSWNIVTFYLWGFDAQINYAHKRAYPDGEGKLRDISILEGEKIKELYEAAFYEKAVEN